MKVIHVLSIVLLLVTKVVGSPRGTGSGESSGSGRPPARSRPRMNSEDDDGSETLPSHSRGVPAVAHLPAPRISDPESSENEDDSDYEDRPQPRRRRYVQNSGEPRQDGCFAHNPGYGFDCTPIAAFEPMPDATAEDLAQHDFGYWLNQFFATHAGSLSADGMKVLLRMFLFAGTQGAAASEEFAQGLIAWEGSRRVANLHANVEQFIQNQRRRLASGYNRRHLYLGDDFQEWADDGEEKMRRNVDVITQRRRGPWEETEGNRWLEGVGAAMAVVASMNGEDDEEEGDGEDGRNRRREVSEADDEDDGNKKPAAKKARHSKSDSESSDEDSSSDKEE